MVVPLRPAGGAFHLAVARRYPAVLRCPAPAAGSGRGCRSGGLAPGVVLGVSSAITAGRATAALRGAHHPTQAEVRLP